MTYDGYCFVATGVSSYAFYDGDRCVCSVDHTCAQGDPRRIRCGEQVWTCAPAPDGNACAVLDDAGGDVAAIYRLDARRYIVSAGGDALALRVVNRRLRKAFLYTGMDEAFRALVEYSLDRARAREAFGDSFPRKYLATMDADMDERLRAVALAAPFLDLFDPPIKI